MSRTFLPYAVGAIAIVLWGAAPAATQVAVAGVDAANVGMLRPVLATAVLLPLALVLRLPLPRGLGGWLDLVVSSLGGFVGFTLLFSLGVKQTSTAHAALILAAAPVLTGFIGFALQRRAPRPLWWVGAAVALAGEAVLIGSRASGAAPDAATLPGDLLVLASVLFVSCGYVAGGRLAAQIGTWAATVWGISLAGVCLLPVLAGRIDWAHSPLSDANTGSWLAVLYLAFCASILGYVAWYWALQRGGVVQISALQFVQPVVSLAIAVVLFAEPLSAPIAMALLLILAGVSLTRVALRRPSGSPP